MYDALAGKASLGPTEFLTRAQTLACLPTARAQGLEGGVSRESARYLNRAPGPADIRSTWVGLRPLVKPQGDDGDDTKALSREQV
jgi:glycerol-3-phosphate dehydrogenase